MLEHQRVRECERRASIQGEDREAMLEHERLRLCERRASLQGKERETVRASESA